jgi:hypothetical protein
MVKMDYEVKAAEFEDACGDGNDPRIARALRAVVKMHKPFSTKGFEGDPICQECTGLDANDWPCLTIQAIEKELG